MILLDSTFLLLFLDDKAAVPKDPATGKPYEKGRERIEHLIDQVSAQKIPVLVPTPVLAEILVRTGPALGDYLAKVRSVPGFRIGNFDQKAAVEVAMMSAAAIGSGKKRGAASQSAPWQKIKIDRQIVGIAKSEGVSNIYSFDADLRKLADAEGIHALDLGYLPMPPMKSQQDMFPEVK